MLRLEAATLCLSRQDVAGAGEVPTALLQALPTAPARLCCVGATSLSKKRTLCRVGADDSAGCSAGSTASMTGTRGL